MAKPLILITNDDGFRSKGINSLVEALKPLGEIFVIAPNSSRSGMSGAITVKEPIRIAKVWEEEGISIYRCSGTPVDSIKIAINQLLPRKPDVVVSGINHGSNTSISVHYSGTMGAAIEGCFNGIPSVGISLKSFDPDADFTQAEKFAKTIVKDVLKNGLPNGVCLNVNVPDEEQINGVKICRQANGVWSEEFEKRVDPHGGTYYWLTGYFKDHEPDSEETDEWALKNGFVSVVPCMIDLTAYNFMDNLNERLNG
ncbi:5'/3'-nucleotidase SurE [Saccharicrinis sp. FJH62]|uniref:5'/3'-nucleotidase SurE n=1 Tax=Saccharicrinis sp. FJH62 TaxID=3344657 RepID=UPI0035D4B8F2